MKTRLFFLFVILTVLAVGGCRTQSAQSTTNARTGKADREQNDSLAARKTAKQARAEAVFIDGCTERIIGNNQKALLAFREVLELNPNNAAANYEIAGIYRIQKQPDRALKFAMRADSLQPENDWYKLRHAQVLSDLGQHEKAMKLLRQLAERHPEKAFWQYAYADAQLKAGDIKAALSTYDRIEKFDGKSDTLAARRIAAYTLAGDNVAIIGVLEEQITSAPSNESNYSTLYNEYIRQENSAAALRTLERRATAFPYSTAAQLDLAVALRKAGKSKEAFVRAVKGFQLPTEEQRKAKLIQDWYPFGDSIRIGAADLAEVDSLCGILRRVHPDYAGSWTASAAVLKQRGKTTEARQACRKAIMLDKGQWQPWKILLELNDALNDYTAQVKESREATELFPEQPITWFYYGSELMRLKLYREAIDPLETGASYVFDDPTLELKFRFMLIEAYRETNDEKEVVSICKRMLKKYPDNAGITFELCSSYSRQRIELADAQERMNTLCTNNPTNASYFSLLGYLDYQLSEFDKAKTHLQQALKLNANDALTNERMGDLQLALDNKDEAVRYWKIAKSKGSKSPNLDVKINSRGTQTN